MASLRDIRNRIKSIKSTEKITRAMKMIAAVKMKKAQNTLKDFSVYLIELEKKVNDIFKDTSSLNLNDFNLFSENSSKDICCIFLTSDKGLCGSFNVGINKKRLELETSNLLLNNCKNNYIVFGRKGYDILKRENKNILERFSFLDNLILNREIFKISELILFKILNKDFSEVYVIYNKFESIAVQKPVFEKIFPLNKDIFFLNNENNKSDALNYEGDYKKIIESMLNKYFLSKLHNYFLNSLLSEYCFRMKAMENANKSSKDIINKLVLYYNRSRQANITRELIEIISGAESS